MCTDLNQSNVAKRLDEAIEVVLEVRKNVIATAPDSIWRRIQSKMAKYSLINGLIFPLIIFWLSMLLLQRMDSNSPRQTSLQPSNPYESIGSTLWMLLSTLGSMLEPYQPPNN